MSAHGRQLERLLQEAGVRHVRLPDGHTAAALLLSENVPPRVVMELLGQSQMRTTMDIYSHVMPAPAREAANRMGALVRAEGQASATRSVTTQIVESARANGVGLTGGSSNHPALVRRLAASLPALLARRRQVSVEAVRRRNT